MTTIRSWSGDAAGWDALVTADPDGTFDHLAGWHAVVTRALGHECLWWEAVDDRGALEGVLPLVRVRSPLFGHYLVSMPFLNAGGPLGTVAARAALIAHAVAEARRSKVDLLEFRTEDPPPAELALSHRKITHRLPLPADPETLWETLPSKVRNQIRRPTKDGLIARTGLDQREAFYDVFARHMRALGTPVIGPGWFEAIAGHFPREAVFIAVYDGDTPVAGGCGFSWRGSCEITWASARREWSRSAPNMLLYWTFLQEAIARGARLFDFGRCTPGGPTHAFKRQWGGDDIPLAWSQWRAGATISTPSPDRPIFRLATSCWRRLPLGLTNRLGPVLARCLP
jgi:FemAB-related protein (PEP-CTERM system-associated)